MPLEVRWDVFVVGMGRGQHGMFGVRLTVIPGYLAHATTRTNPAKPGRRT